ncbi:WXG100 family type VII secretion target [Kutzneria sp. NPDC052558]|uniref:WXG100 family type VII secretion target n=1 Tax=Kutzneria sp. NPDC052558 TaxID=3364121 RepID=UPI0037CB573A
MAISQIDLQGLMGTASGQQEAIDSVQSDLNNVVSECDSLASAWKGEAAMLFQDAMQNFQEGANKVLGTLREMHEKMVSTHGMFSATNDNINTVARNTGGAMGLPGL